MRDLYNLFEKPKDPLAFDSLKISLDLPLVRQEGR